MQSAGLDLMIEEARRVISTCGELDGTKDVNGRGRKKTQHKSSDCVLAMWVASGKLRALADKIRPFQSNGINKFTTEKSFNGASRRKDVDMWMYTFVVASDCGQSGGKPVHFHKDSHDMFLFQDGEKNIHGNQKRTAMFTGFPLSNHSTEWVEPSKEDYIWADNVFNKYYKKEDDDGFVTKKRKREQIQPSTITLQVPTATELRGRINVAMENYKDQKYKDFYKALADIRKKVNYLCHVGDPDVNKPQNITKYGQNLYVEMTEFERSKAVTRCEILFDGMMEDMEA